MVKLFEDRLVVIDCLLGCMIIAQYRFGAICKSRRYKNTNQKMRPFKMPALLEGFREGLGQGASGRLPHGVRVPQRSKL